MDADHHPDPFRDAAQHGVHRAVQIASCAVTATQVYLYQQKAQARAVAERDERARRALQAQARAERDAARAAWAPALDPAWLREATLIQAAQVWGAAMPYADKAVPWYEPAAAAAMRKCEDRLRDLHPYAMARYDRLRSEGLEPAQAMTEAAPFFARAPRPYDAPGVPRQALAAGNGSPAWTTAPPVGDHAAVTDAQVLERRGRQMLGTLQDRAREQGRRPLGEAEQRTVLEALTSLPPEIIDRIVPPARAGARGARPPAGRSARPWEHDFPHPIREVVTAAASAAPGVAAPPAAARAPGRPVHCGRRS